MADTQDGQHKDDKGTDESHPALSARRRLSINETLTLLVAIGSLVVSYLTYQASKDTTEIKGAISQIAKLADQTKRQADATSGQLDQIKRQADSSVIIANAAKDSASAAQAQTKAISQQTAAIKSSSDANIRAAKAQQNMADVTAKSQMPVPDLSEVSITNFNEPPDNKGMVKVNLMWRFRNVGGSAFVVKDVELGLWFGPALPEEMPDGRIKVNGLGISVPNNIASGFAPAQPMALPVSKEFAQAVMSKKSKVFFYAVMNYADQMGTSHARCFGREFIMASNNINSDFPIPAGGKAYNCQS